MIDHVALWKRALTDSEIAGLSGVEKLQYPDIYREKYRPQFHFSARRHWINDPNGLVFYKGEYHLYFQYMPPARPGAFKDWGHAVSTDLVHWTQLPTAALPARRNGAGAGRARPWWMPRTRAGWPRARRRPIVAAVTSGGHPALFQCIAYSLDRGRSFTMYDGNPVIGHIADIIAIPKVTWHVTTKRWIMVFYLDQQRFRHVRLARPEAMDSPARRAGAGKQRVS